MSEEQPPINKKQRDEKLDNLDLPLDERMEIAKEELDKKLDKDKKPKRKKTKFIPTTYAAERSKAMDEEQDNKKSRGSLPGYDSEEIE
jgi:hypothetical protein